MFDEITQESLRCRYSMAGGGRYCAARLNNIDTYIVTGIGIHIIMGKDLDDV